MKEAIDIVPVFRSVVGEYTPTTSYYFLLLPIAPSVSCSWLDALNTPSSKLPLSPAVSRCLPLSATCLSLLPNPHPEIAANRTFVKMKSLKERCEAWSGSASGEDDAARDAARPTSTASDDRHDRRKPPNGASGKGLWLGSILLRLHIAS